MYCWCVRFSFLFCFICLFILSFISGHQNKSGKLSRRYLVGYNSSVIVTAVKCLVFFFFLGAEALCCSHLVFFPHQRVHLLKVCNRRVRFPSSGFWSSIGLELMDKSDYFLFCWRFQLQTCGLLNHYSAASGTTDGDSSWISLEKFLPS